MWASLSLLLVILTLALSLRFYLQHCWYPSDTSATVSRQDWQGPRLELKNSNPISISTRPVSPSLKTGSKSLKTTQTT